MSGDTENIGKILAQNEQLLEQNKATHEALAGQGREISATHANLTSMGKRITEHRIEQRRTNDATTKQIRDNELKIVGIETRVGTIERNTDTQTSLPKVQAPTGNEWFLSPKQWAAVSVAAIFFCIGAVEIFIKVYKAMSP